MRAIEVAIIAGKKLANAGHAFVLQCRYLYTSMNHQRKHFKETFYHNKYKNSIMLIYMYLQ